MPQVVGTEMAANNLLEYSEKCGEGNVILGKLCQSGGNKNDSYTILKISI